MVTWMDAFLTKTLFVALKLQQLNQLFNNFKV
jgi:hypothetical protein